MRGLLILAAGAAAAVVAKAACPWDSEPALTSALSNACVCGHGEGGATTVGCAGSAANFTALALALQATAQSTVLGELSLSNTSVPTLPDFVFRGLKIISLRITGCGLSSVGPQAFRGLENTLQTLDLSGNQLSGSADDVIAALRPMRLVSTLDLSSKFDKISLH